MPTVIDDTTGEEVEVKQVHAVAISANQATAGTTITATQAKRIEHAMSMAVVWCNQEGIVDPEVIKEKMQQARAAIKRKFVEEAEEEKRLQAEEARKAEKAQSK